MWYIYICYTIFSIFSVLYNIGICIFAFFYVLLENMFMNKYNPLKNYFYNAKTKYNLETYSDIAKHFGITRGIVSNVLCDQTLNPSRKLTKILSSNLNQKPEIVLKDIYINSFCEPCNEYLKVVTLSLFYNFGYTLFFDEHNFMQFYQIPLPFTMNHRICSFAKIRNNGPELKYTLVLDWSNVRDVLCNAYTNTFDYFYEPNHDPTKPFKNWPSFFFAMTSGLYSLMNLDSMSNVKRIIVVFPREEEFVYENIRDGLSNSSPRILPLLYDESAQYSIHDIDQIKK